MEILKEKYRDKFLIRTCAGGIETPISRDGLYEFYKEIEAALGICGFCGGHDADCPYCLANSEQR